MQAFYDEFGQKLKIARRGARLSQDQLATRVALSRTSITNIEHGRQHIPLHLLIELSDALGVAPASLLPTRVSQTRVGLPAGLDANVKSWVESRVADGLTRSGKVL